MENSKKYYQLKAQFALRGWRDEPYGLTDTGNLQCNRLVLSKEQFYALELAASGVEAASPFFPRRYLRLAEKAVELGILEYSSVKTMLSPWQRYRKTSARYIHSVLWSITGKCNLRCRHCYVCSGDNKYGELPLEKCAEIIDQMVEANISAVALTGGEPLVRKDFWTIVDMLLKQKIQIINLFTNGMLVDADFVKQCRDRELNPIFLISFDGVGCHDWLRRVEGSEQKAIDAVRLLKKEGYRVIVTTVFHENNIDSLFATYELMKELEVDMWKLGPVMDTGNWKKEENKINISTEILFDKYLHLLSLYKKDEYPIGIGIMGFYFRYKDGSWKLPSEQGEDESQYLCQSARRHPYLMANGRFIPCIAMSGTYVEDEAPDVWEYSLEELLTNSPYTELVDKTQEDLFEHNPECGNCVNRLRCKSCRANPLCSANDYFGKDTIACTFWQGNYKEKIEKILG